MGLWPFGREPSDVEIATRVVTAAARDHVTVRGKVTLHFLEPQTQEAADSAADECVELCAVILRDAPSVKDVIGAEATIVSQLVSRLPAGFAPTRAIELVSLHVVGEAARAGPVRRPSSGAIAAVIPPTGGSTPPALISPMPGAVLPSNPMITPIPGAYPSTPAQGISRPPQRRASSTRMRAVSVVIPPGSAPPAIGAAAAPFVRDSAARLLVGILRAHDLLVVRRVALDASSPEMLSALVPVSEVPPGAFEASRGQELGRWQHALGAERFARLRHEAGAFAVYLAYVGMLQANVVPPVASQVVEALCAHAFPPNESPLAEIGRYVHAADPQDVSTLASRMIRALGEPDQTWTLAPALAPLLGAVQEDMAFVATLIRHASS